MSKSRKSLLVVLGAAVVLMGVMFVFAGCGGGSGASASIVGKWHSDADKETVEFRADGTMAVATADGYTMDAKYAAAQGKLTVTVEGTDPIPATYKLSGDELTVTGKDTQGKDTSTAYKRVK